MTRDDIINIAIESGIRATHPSDFFSSSTETLERFASLVAAAEREECAKLCDDLQQSWSTAGECADSIRARSN